MPADVVNFSDKSEYGYSQIVLKFAQDVAKILSVNIFVSEWSYCNPFRNAAVLNKRKYPNFALKLVAMATSLNNSHMSHKSRTASYLA